MRPVLTGLFFCLGGVLGVVFIFLGSCLSNDLVWELSDLFNQLMVIPNALALLALSALVVRAAKGSK